MKAEALVLVGEHRIMVGRGGGPGRARREGLRINVCHDGDGTLTYKCVAEDAHAYEDAAGYYASRAPLSAFVGESKKKLAGLESEQFSARLECAGEGGVVVGVVASFNVDSFVKGVVGTCALSAGFHFTTGKVVYRFRRRRACAF